MYEDVSRAIYSLFKTDSWLLNGLSIIPEGLYEVPQKYGVVKISFSELDSRHFRKGILYIIIHTEINKGPGDHLHFADCLDNLLVGKSMTINNFSIQFAESKLNGLGKDTVNTALDRHQYSINFTYAGVL